VSRRTFYCSDPRLREEVPHDAIHCGATLSRSNDRGATWQGLSMYVALPILEDAAGRLLRPDAYVDVAASIDEGDTADRPLRRCRNHRAKRPQGARPRIVQKAGGAFYPASAAGRPSSSLKQRIPTHRRSRSHDAILAIGA
jgi:hypothetical protein